MNTLFCLAHQPIHPTYFHSQLNCYFLVLSLIHPYQICYIVTYSTFVCLDYKIIVSLVVPLFILRLVEAFKWPLILSPHHSTAWLNHSVPSNPPLCFHFTSILLLPFLKWVVLLVVLTISNFGSSTYTPC